MASKKKDPNKPDASQIEKEVLNPSGGRANPPRELSPMEKAERRAKAEERKARRDAGKTQSGAVRKDAASEADDAPDYTGFLDRQASGTGVQLGPRAPRYRKTTPSPVGNTGITPSETEMRRREAVLSVRGRSVTKTRKKDGKVQEVTKRIPPSVPLTLKDVRANRRFLFGDEAGGSKTDDVSPTTIFVPTAEGGLATEKGIPRNEFETIPMSTETKGLEREKEKATKLAKNIRNIADVIKQVPESVPTGDYVLRDVSMPDEPAKPGPVAVTRPGRLSDIASSVLKERLRPAVSSVVNQDQSRGQAPGNQQVQRRNRGLNTAGTINFLNRQVVGEAPPVVKSKVGGETREYTPPTPSSAQARREKNAPISEQLTRFAETVEAEGASIPDVYDPKKYGVRFYGGMTVADIAETPEDVAAVVEGVSKNKTASEASHVVLGPVSVVGDGPESTASPAASGVAGEVNASLMKIKDINVRKRRAQGLAAAANNPRAFPVKQGENRGIIDPSESKIIPLPSETKKGKAPSGQSYSRAMTPEERAKVAEAADKPGSPAGERRVIKKIRKSMGIPKQSTPLDERTQSERRRTISDVVSDLMIPYQGRGGGDQQAAAYAEMSGEAASNPNAGIIATRKKAEPWVGPTGKMDLNTQTLSDDDMSKLRVTNPNLASMFDRVSGKGAPYPPIDKPMMSANPASPNYDPRAQESISRSIRHNTNIEENRKLPPGPLTEGWTPPPKTSAEKREVKEVKERQSARSKFLNRPEADVEASREAAKREIFVGTEQEERAASPLRAALFSKMEQQTGEKVFGQVAENRQVFARGNVSMPGTDYGKMQLDVSRATPRGPALNRVVNQIQYEAGWDTRPASQRGEPYYRVREGAEMPAVVNQRAETDYEAAMKRAPRAYTDTKPSDFR